MAVFKNGIFAYDNGKPVTPQSLGISLSGIQTCRQFFSSGSITNNTQQYAVYALVSDLERYNIWDKMRAIYPMVGQAGVSSSFQLNLKDPNTFRGTFYGGWSFSTTGATPDGTSAYFDTTLNPSGIIDANNLSISTYLRTDTNGLFCDLGATGGSSYQYSIYARLSNSLFTDLGTSVQGRITYANTDSRGHFISTRTSSTSFKSFINSTLKATLTTTQTDSILSRNIFLGAMNDATATIQFSNRENAFAHIGDGLSDTEAANFYTAVQRFQTTLGRQV